ncbi:hypothetical protein ACIQI8_41390 [Streptomyces sp. NPDC092369]|uniref:hypothetical protein n=1 Tax=Streptomyces sp. NPDC092369 TaxID=3366015 RepID=UPI0037F315CA
MTAVAAGALALGLLMTDGPALGAGPSNGLSPTGPVREVTTAEQTRIDQAEQILIKGCMERQGFRYWVIAPLAPERLRAFEHPFVRDDLGWARAHGYGGAIQRAFFATKKKDPNIAYRKSLTPTVRARYLTALNGGSDSRRFSVRLPAAGSIRTAVGGCELEARKKLYGDVEAYFRADKIATNLIPLYAPRLMKDRRFTQALHAWSQCMGRRAGRAYADPQAVQSDLPGRTEGLSDRKADALERKLAVAEAICARTSTLATTARHLDVEYGAPVRRQYADDIRTGKRMRLAALAEADTLRITAN